MAVTDLIVVHLGQESTWGLTTRGTVKLMGVTDSNISVAQEVDQPDIMGTLAPATVATQQSIHGEGSIEQQASYQDICYWLGSAFGGTASSAAANTTYMWRHSAPLGTKKTPKWYTVEYGPPGGEYEMVGSIVSGLTISFEAMGTWEVSVDLVGKSIAAAAKSTAGLRTVDLIRASDTALYMDTWAGTIGSTAVAATLISGELSLNPGAHLKTFVGSISPGSYGVAKWEGQLTLVLEFNASAKAIVDALLAPALIQRQIRLTATTGSGTTAREATIDYGGTLVDAVELYGDRDGNCTIETVWNGTYRSRFLNWLKIGVKNELATLP